MEVLDCPGCRARDALIAEMRRQIESLLRRVAELEARLKANSTNSSLPPSANPLTAPPPPRKKKSKRRRGGQPGHPPHLRQLLPADRVTRVESIVPATCDACRARLPRRAGPNDPEPKRFQSVELPEIAVEVVEYQAHARTCPRCQQVTQAAIPAAIRAHSIGPRLTAAMSYFTGAHGLSKRDVEAIVETVFGVPVALGTVANLEGEVSAALVPAHAEALEAVRRAEVKHADETGWKKWGRLCWLWGAATATAAVYVVHAQRGTLGLAALLGEAIQGIVHSDRWHVYRQVPEERRQVCWAHLKRDFQGIVDRSGPGAFVGRRGLRVVRDLFAAWQAFRGGTIDRERLQALLAGVQRRLDRTLLQGAFGEDARVASFCAHLIELEGALWTFGRVEGVEPTNNFMERLMRRAVLWRRRSFGCNSEAGCRFVERILTVVQTCRLNARNSLEYLAQAVAAQRRGDDCPRLLAEG